MVKRERKKSTIMFVPECTCNTKVNRVVWKDTKAMSNPNAESYAEDHEELHTLSRSIIDFIVTTGKMMKEDIIENFPSYNEKQLSVAANLSMNPIVFPKRRRAPPSEFERLKQYARALTEEYRRSKYASIDEENTEDSNAE